MTTPTKVLLLGKDPTMTAAVIEILKPDFEVIKHAQSIPEATSYVSSLMGSGPQIVLLGGGFSNNDYEALRAFTDEIKQQYTWMRPQHFRPGATVEPPKGPPTPEQVAARVRKGVDQSGVVSSTAHGEIFYY